MKKIFLLMAICMFALNACTYQEETPVTSVELNAYGDDAKIQELTSQLKSINSKVPETRGWKFFDRLVSVLYSDASGYSWGRERGLDWKFSLISGGVFSIATAIFNGESIVVVDKKDYVQADYKVNYSIAPATKMELSGVIHNDAVVKVIAKPDNQMKILKMDESLVQETSAKVNQSLVQYKDQGFTFLDSELEATASIDFPKEIEADLIHSANVLAQQGNLTDIHRVAKEMMPTEANVLDLLEQCVIRIGDINNKEDVRTFVEQLNKEIDNLSLSTENTEYLKTIVSIAENSYSLWDIKE